MVSIDVLPWISADKGKAMGGFGNLDSVVLLFEVGLWEAIGFSQVQAVTGSMRDPLGCGSSPKGPLRAPVEQFVCDSWVCGLQPSARVLK